MSLTSPNHTRNSTGSKPEPINHGNEPKRTTVLFIGGLGRSGSTLVEKLINELPGTRAVGETMHLWERGLRDQELCGCGEPLLACDFWCQVGEKAFGGWSNLKVQEIIDQRSRLDRTRRFGSILRAVRSGQLTSDQQAYVSYYHRLLDAAASVPTSWGQDQPESASAVLLESSKHVSTAGLLAAGKHLDVRVVHLIRDPRGVAYSWTKKIERPEAPGLVMPTYPPARTAMRWVTDNAAFDLLSLYVPTLRLRYESFLSSPASTLLEIAHFAGLDLTADDVAFADQKTIQLTQMMHSAAGNPMRFGGDTITLRTDEAWKEKLPANARRVVSAISLPALFRYGYSL